LSILFISHSSKDNEVALRVRDWLSENGWTQIFLDLDPERGLAPGHQWQQELKQAGERCAAVLVLISPDWIVSRWCQTEFLVADQLGKKIFPLVVAPTPFEDLPLEIRSRFQLADISTPDIAAEGYTRLALGLRRAGLGPSSFDWPPRNDPHRSIYRGLKSLDEQDAAIFFGRDANITKGLDALRRMRDGAVERIFVVLGASGAGKSSFLKAGLLARLQRDQDNFVALPAIRPGQAAISGKHGLAASLGIPPSRLKSGTDLIDAFAKRREEASAYLQRFADNSSAELSISPTIVVSVDQAEELFSSDNEEADRFLDLIAAAFRADSNFLLVVTIRSDNFAKLQNDTRISDIPRLPFDLPQLPRGAFKEVIEGPARLAQPPLTIDPDLTDRLLVDLASDDALPLLAFTLERLTLRREGGANLSLREYADELGGLQGAIMAAVDEAFATAARDPALPKNRNELEKITRAAFIPALVRLDSADAEPMRRLERMEALPLETRTLVRHLIDQHLLTSDRAVIGGQETDTIEVAHEAILRQWPSLRAWIAEERDALRALDAAQVAATEWDRHSNGQNGDVQKNWLIHRGQRLQEVEALLTQPGFASVLGATGLRYLAACRANEADEQQREKERLIATRRMQRVVGGLIIVAAAVVLIVGAGAARLFAGAAGTASELLAAQSARLSNMGAYDLGARYALSGLAQADWPFIEEYGADAQAELVGDILVSSAAGVLHGHDNQVLNASYSRDGKRIVTASRDGSARLWYAANGRLIGVLPGHKREVLNAAFSPDGKRVVTASGDATAAIWDVEHLRRVAVLRGHKDAVISAAFSPDGKKVATASYDHTVRIWDANSWHPISIIPVQDEAVESLGFSPDGSHIVTASDDGTANIWDLSALTHIVLKGHDGSVEGASYSPDGKRVVTASDDKTARIWEAATGKLLHVLSGHQKGVTAAAFSPDGSRVVTSSQDQTARIWDAQDGHEISVLRGHDDVVNSAIFNPDGTKIVTASDDKTARIWNANPSQEIVVLHGHASGVNGVAFSPDEKLVVTASTDNTAAIWDAISGRRISLLRGHEGIVETAMFSPDGSKVITASDDKTARIWDVKTAKQLGLPLGHDEAVYSADFSPDGKLIVTASRDATARIWDAETHRSITVLRGHHGQVLTAAFGPRGRRVVTASSDGSARIWEAKSGREMAELRGHIGGVTSALFSRDGTRVVVAYRDKTIGIWDVATLREIGVLSGHQNSVTIASFNFDGSQVVSASRDGTARLWDTKTMREIAVLRGHGAALNAVAFSPDGKMLATASEDNTARIWHLSSIGSMDRRALIAKACSTVLANGLNWYSAKEIGEVPVLNAQLDGDACSPPTAWARFKRIFWGPAH
jgi:WD40 repeat protein